MKNVDNPFKSPAVLSLCTGMCGLERGIERAIGELRPVAYVEIEAFIIENLITLMEQGVLAPAPVWADAKTFPGREFHGKICGIIGGYPCQPFSSAGKRRGAEDPRHLWPYISGIIRATGPVWCFFENVEGHLSMGYAEVYRELRALGYRVESGTYSAEEAGAPHKRKRLFIFAVLENTDIQRMRGWYNDIIDGRRAVQAAGSGNLAYTNGTRTWGEPEKFDGGTGEQNVRQGNGESCAVWTVAAGGDTEQYVPDPHQPGLQSQSRGWRGTIFQPDEKHAGRELAGIPAANGQLADPHFWWEQRWQYAGMGWPEQPVADLWPAPPGYGQHSWEHPRTISGKAKPIVGCTINGYNFREDLLRMYGNGVVEQTAEIAFLDLLKKHCQLKK